MKRLKVLFSYFCLFFVFLSFVSFVFADDNKSVEDYINPIKINAVSGGSIESSVSSVFSNIAANFLNNVVFGIIGIIVLCLFVFSGLKYILARGNPEEIKKANGFMKYAIIGLVLVFSSYIIINFIFTIIKNIGGN